MADEFKIVASLNIEKSTGVIKEDIKKLQDQIKNEKVKIVAGLDIAKSKNLIQSQLNTLANQAKAPTIKVGIDTSGLNSVQGATQNITNSLQTVQTQAQQTASAVSQIMTNMTAKNVSDSMVSEFQQAFEIVGKKAKSTKQTFKSLFAELNNAWYSGNEEQYLKVLEQIFNVAQKNTKVLKMSKAEIASMTDQIKSSFTDGGMTLIPEQVKSELEYILGKGKQVQQVLSTIYGIGKWSYSKGVATDVQASGNILGYANEIVDAYNKIQQIKSSSEYSVLSTFENDRVSIEECARSILKLTNSYRDLQGVEQTYIQGWGWVEEVVAENERVNASLNTVQKEARETAIALGEIGHNFISNNKVQATFSSIKQAEEYFKSLNLGKVSLSLNKGSLQGLTDFTVKIKSATGEIERFRYAVNNVGDDQNPILEYNLTNINASNEAVQRLINSYQKAQDKVKALRTNLTAELKSIRSAWQDVNGGKSVKSDENIERLKQQYIKVTQAIRELRNADDTTLASMKANADAQIDKLNQMVTQYHNAEKVATQLRARGFETVKIDTGNNIDKFINSINNSKVPIQAMQTEINKLTNDFAQLDTIQDQAGKSAALTNILNTLDNAKTKFQSLKELFKGFGNADWLSVNSEQINKINDMATKIAIYKNNLTATRDEWKSQGIYVGEIQSKVTSLARSLPNIKKPEKFNEWVQEWNDINQKANQLKVNLDSQVATHNKIYEIQSQIAKLNPTKDNAEIARLNEKLSAEQKTLSNLQMQSNVYSNLVSLEQQEQYITEQTVKSRDKLLSATNAGVKQYQTTITNAITELQGITNSAIFTKNASNPAVTQTKQDINSLITAYQNLATKLQGNITPAGLETVRTELTQLNARFNDATNTAKRFETELRSDNGAEQLAQKVELLTQRIKAYRQANSKSEKRFGSQYDSMLSQLANPNIDLNTYNALNKQFQTMRQEINAANVAGKTLWQTFEEKSKKFIGWMSMTFLYSLMFRAFRSAITNVIELDKAMTNLKKVTDETDTAYAKFLNNASTQAKELHSTITDLVEQTAVWAKLGYSLNEAQNLATTSMIYSKVGEVENSKSVSDLVTVMKAFNIESEKSIRIVDSLNELGNNFATSASDLGEGLTKSASALRVANNSFEQSIALLTGGTEITQNANEMGSALKVISMRIRGMKGELEALGEEYDNIESISKIQTQILNLTKGKVNIFDNNGNFRSTYDILKDISDVYNDLSDPTKADLTEILFGKMRGNQGVALIQAFQSGQIQKAYETALNSAGSAQKEFDSWSKSIEAHIETFKASFESLSKSLIKDNFLIGLVDSGTKFIDILDKIINDFGTIPTLIGGTALFAGLKNVGGLLNTPVYAQPQLICA